MSILKSFYDHYPHHGMISDLDVSESMSQYQYGIIGGKPIAVKTAANRTLKVEYLCLGEPPKEWVEIVNRRGSEYKFEPEFPERVWVLMDVNIHVDSNNNLIKSNLLLEFVQTEYFGD